MPEEMSDAEELREILGAVSEFLKGLKEPLMDIVSTVMDSLSGEKVGSDIAAFYRKLVEAGMPEQLAAEMTKEYMETRLKAVPSLGSLLESFKIMGERRASSHTKKDISRTIAMLEKLKEKHPEKKEKIEKAIEKLKGVAEIRVEETEGTKE